MAVCAGASTALTGQEHRRARFRGRAKFAFFCLADNLFTELFQLFTDLNIVDFRCSQPLVAFWKASKLAAEAAAKFLQSCIWPQPLPPIHYFIQKRLAIW